MFDPDDDRSPSDDLDQTDMMEVGAALARGDAAAAREALDKAFRDDATAREWLEQGARSRSARMSVAA